MSWDTSGATTQVAFDRNPFGSGSTSLGFPNVELLGMKFNQTEILESVVAHQLKSRLTFPTFSR